MCMKAFDLILYTKFAELAFSSMWSDCSVNPFLSSPFWHFRSQTNICGQLNCSWRTATRLVIRLVIVIRLAKFAKCSLGLLIVIRLAKIFLDFGRPAVGALLLPFCKSCFRVKLKVIVKKTLSQAYWKVSNCEKTHQVPWLSQQLVYECHCISRISRMCSASCGCNWFIRTQM